MNLFNYKEKKAVRSVRLTDEEKNRMRGNLLSYVDTHPVSSGLSELSNGISFVNSLGNFFAAHRLKCTAAFAAIILILGGGVSYAAEGALPGDILYRIKVSITEPVRGALAFGATASARWEAEKAKHRLDEASELVSQGRFDEEKKKEIAQRFNESSDQFEIYMSVIDTKDATTTTILRTEFSTSLSLRTETLAQIKNMVSQELSLKIGKLEEEKAKIAGKENPPKNKNNLSVTATSSVKNVDYGSLDTGKNGNVAGNESSGTKVSAPTTSNDTIKAEVNGIQVQTVPVVPGANNLQDALNGTVNLLPQTIPSSPKGDEGKKTIENVLTPLP